MPAPWRVVRFAQILDPAFEQGLAREPAIALHVAPIPASFDDAVAALQGADIYHCGSARNEMSPHTFATAALLDRLPALRVVSSYGAGYDPIDVPACTARGIAVVNQSGANKVSVAEHTLALILDVVHRISENDRRMRVETIPRREDVMGREIAGRTLGLVGIGNIGTCVASLGRAFAMDVIAADPFVDADEVARRGARKVSFEELLARADIVSLHCPREPATIGLMDAAAFARMKRGAVFVSTARGGIHDERALAQALASGHLMGAGLDVWEPEPPPLDHPLLKLPNVVATYHTAGVTHEARRNIAVLGAEQIVSIVRGERPPRLVNPEAWPAVQARLASTARSP